MGLISTFCSSATSPTTYTRAMQWSTMCSKTTKPKPNSTTDTNSVTSLVTLSESDIQILLTRLMQAINMKNNTNNNTPTKEPTGGQNTGSQKWSKGTLGSEPQAKPRETNKMHKRGHNEQNKPLHIIYKMPPHPLYYQLNKSQKQFKITKT